MVVTGDGHLRRALTPIFDQRAAAELKQVALSGQSLDDRQAAILALTRARTPQAVAALNDLASQVRQQSAQPPGPKRH